MRYVILALFIAVALALFALSYCYIGLPLFDAGIIPMCAIGFAVALATLPDDNGHGGCA